VLVPESSSTHRKGISMTIQRRDRAAGPTWLASLVLIITVAACGGPAATSATPPPTETPDGPGPSVGGATTPPSAGSDLVACDLLSDEDIAEIVDGAVVGSMTDDAQDTVFANHCRWALQDAAGGTLGQIDLGILSPGGRERYDRSYTILAWETVEGLPADDALRDPSLGSIAAVRGDVLVDIITQFLSDEQGLALVERVLENLADD
jgi:Protein of unknown function (DUF3558)